MRQETKRVPVRFYRTESGNEPVREWLKSLGKRERFLIGTDIKTVEFGWPIGMPVCRSMGRDPYEVRTNLPSNRTSRVLFCFSEGKMILLHGFIKKSRETPKPDLALAEARMRALES